MAQEVCDSPSLTDYPLAGNMMSPDDIKPAQRLMDPNVMDSWGLSRAEAIDHLLTTEKRTLPLTDSEIQNALAMLGIVQKSVQDAGDKLVRNQMYVNAREKGMKNTEKTGPVNSFQDVVTAFRNAPSISNCVIVFESMVTWPHVEKTHANKWMPSMVEKIKMDLNITFTRKPRDKEPSFIEVIVEKKCMVNMRAMFAADPKGKWVGISMKKDTRHPLGPAPLGCDSHTFQFQNIRNWELLCREDKKAARIESMMTKAVDKEIFKHQPHTALRDVRGMMDRLSQPPNGHLSGKSVAQDPIVQQVVDEFQNGSFSASAARSGLEDTSSADEDEVMNVFQDDDNSFSAVDDYNPTLDCGDDVHADSLLSVTGGAEMTAGVADVTVDTFINATSGEEISTIRGSITEVNPFVCCVWPIDVHSFCVS